MDELGLPDMSTGEEIPAVTAATPITSPLRETTPTTRFLNETLSDAPPQDPFQGFEQAESSHEHIPKSSSGFDQTEPGDKSPVEDNQQSSRTVQQNRAEKTSAKLDLSSYSNQEIKRALIRRRKTFREEGLEPITPEEPSDESSDEKSKRRKQKAKAGKQKAKEPKSTPQKGVSDTLKEKNARIMALVCDHIFSYHAYIRR